MYERGQKWLWGKKTILIDDVSRYLINQEERVTGRVRELKEGDEIGLQTITIDLSKEKDNMNLIGKMEDSEYIHFVTAVWHKKVPETRNHVVCSMKEATHVIFSEMDLALAGEDGKDFTAMKVYPVGKEAESGDLYIINDKDDIMIGFDLFIPCEYLKLNNGESDEQNQRVLATETMDNVVSISDYLKRKRK